MGLILCIETSTKACSTAICRDGAVVEKRFLHTGAFNHAERLNPLIEESMQAAGLPFSDLEAVAVSGGPGSYTGLRIGVSTAKGLCYALNIPLITIDTLQLLALEAARQHSAEFYLPMIDARRMEVYTAVYDNLCQPVHSPEAHVLSDSSFGDLLREKSCVICGDGAEKASEILKGKTLTFLKDIHPMAEHMKGPAEEKFRLQKFADSAYYEPFYLKEFHQTS